MRGFHRNMRNICDARRGFRSRGNRDRSNSFNIKSRLPQKADGFLLFIPYICRAVFSVPGDVLRSDSAIEIWRSAPPSGWLLFRL